MSETRDDAMSSKKLARLLKVMNSEIVKKRSRGMSKTRGGAMSKSLTATAASQIVPPATMGISLQGSMSGFLTGSS
jgi:hypothetical protein